ncbi:hypothetical protein DMA11_20255 [Marinilabiliaceae bacterium JC017]|nr:hypothetical protein DMA11_20255 [Marinilabiliaceae bacterium JC017]
MLKLFLELVLIVLILGLFFLQKVGTHSDLLKHPFDKIHVVLKSIFKPVTELFKSFKPVEIGTGLSLDIVPFIILGLLILLLEVNF